MASIVVAGNTSGSITISAPDVSGSNTLTLPAATGTVIYADGSGNLQANSGYGSVATGYLCRAWVNFNGTGTVAIRASGNVTSITDGGVGVYTVNFTTAMPDANYSTSGSAGGTNASYVFNKLESSPPTVNAVTVTAVTPNVALRDDSNINVAIFR